MNLFRKNTLARGFINALMLALLLNLSGHVFFHLGDPVPHADETHLSASHEASAVSASQHQCSVCQDHQQRTVDTSAPAAELLAAAPLSTPRNGDVTPDTSTYRFHADRAPPRN